MSDVDATPQFDRTEATLPAAARRSRGVGVGQHPSGSSGWP
ncbi:MAG: hypothetical protein R2853_05240 [Thermomicrobiales bacterium]